MRWFLRDRLISEIKHDGSELVCDYDAAGNRRTLTVMAANAASTTTQYDFDALNRLQSVTAPDGRVTTYTYDANGNQTEVTHGNGTRSETLFDALNRIESITHRNAGNQILAQLNYTLDATGRRTAITEANGRRSDYTYDELYRLTDESITDPVNGNHQSSYQYDAVGNRTYETVNSVQTSYIYDDNDRLLQSGGTRYGYDANDNTLSETLDFVTSTNTWDSQNRLIGRDTNGQGIVMPTTWTGID